LARRLRLNQREVSADRRRDLLAVSPVQRDADLIRLHHQSFMPRIAEPKFPTHIVIDRLFITLQVV
jgi:hypothetical protein